MMGILSAHALVGTGGSGKTKAGFELGGRPLGLAALSLSLTIPSNASAASLLHTSHFRHSVFTLTFRGTAHPTPWYPLVSLCSLPLIHTHSLPKPSPLEEGIPAVIAHLH